MIGAVDCGILIFKSTFYYHKSAIHYPISEIDLVSPCTTARKRLYSPAGIRDIIHKVNKIRSFPDCQVLLDCKPDLPIMTSVFSFNISVDKEH